MADPKTADKPTVIDIEPTHETFELIEREDEEQILCELQGRVTEKYVYELKGQKDENGNPVHGLSWSGTNWACREFAKRGEAIRIVSKPEIQRDPISDEHIVVSVVAQRVAINLETGRETFLDSSVGIKRQWVKRERKKWENGQVVGKEILVDDFYLEKAVSKAQRNAKQALLPTDFVKEVVKQAIAQKNNPKAAGAAKTPAKPAGSAATPPAASQGASKAAPAKGADPIGAMRQKLWTVLKRASGVTDDTAARQTFKALSGKEKVSDLDEASLKALGNALGGVIKGENQFQKRESDGVLYLSEKATGKILYPNPMPAEKAAPAPEEPQEAAPGDDVMF